MIVFKKSIFCLLLIFFSFSFTGCKEKNTVVLNNNNLLEITLNNVKLFVETADTPEKQELGLMFRKSMPDNHGMLFIFNYEKKLSFWMKNTIIPLSLAYARHDGTIVDIINMEPFDERPHQSSTEVLYALEVNKGWFDKNGIKKGDKISFSKNLK